jgi:hypothetical protein
MTANAESSISTGFTPHFPSTLTAMSNIYSVPQKLDS